MAVSVRHMVLRERPERPARVSGDIAIPDAIGHFILQPRQAGTERAVYQRVFTIPPRGRFTLALPSLSEAVCDDVSYSMEPSPSVRASLEADELVFDSDLDEGHQVEVTVSFIVQDGPSRPGPEQKHLRLAK